MKELPAAVIFQEENEWGYSNIPQNNNDSWYNVDNDWITYTPNYFPVKTTTTTYYRTKFVLPDIYYTNSPTLRVKYRDGLIVYINGIEIFRKNMPLDEEISSETKATKSFDELTESIISIPQPIIYSLGNYIAIEIHKSESSPFLQNDEFSASIQTNERSLYEMVNSFSINITVESTYGYKPTIDRPLSNMLRKEDYCSLKLTKGNTWYYFPMN